MRQLPALVSVALGGALGSMLRFLVTLAFVARFGASFPWGTFVINVTGSFLIGVVLGAAQARDALSPYLRAFLVAGVLGGYTTFSAFAFETYGLLEQGFAARAFGYALGSVVLGVLAAYAGTLVVRLTLH